MQGARPLSHQDAFVDRHLGPRPADAAKMLEFVGAETLEALIDEAVPAVIRS